MTTIDMTYDEMAEVAEVLALAYRNGEPHMLETGSPCRSAYEALRAALNAPVYAMGYPAITALDELVGTPISGRCSQSRSGAR